MKFFVFLFFLISLSHSITSKTSLENLSQTIKTLEGNLLYYYIHEKKTKVKGMLTKIKLLDENTYKRDKEIIEYWEYVDNSMTFHKNVAPDGLPQTPDHAFVVLGYALNPDGSLKREGKGRCDVAYESAMKYPNSLIFVTGGLSARKNKTSQEGGQMKDYLVNVKGLDGNRIITEIKSKETIQNVKYTMEKLIEKNIKTITVITSDYHLRRGSILFKGEALIKAESLGITPIQILGNAVYSTGKSTEGKFMEGYDLGAILNVKIRLTRVIIKMKIKLFFVFLIANIILISWKFIRISKNKFQKRILYNKYPNNNK